MKSTHALLAFGAAICLATTCSLSAYASPLKNYDAGKVAIDAGITLPSSLKGDNYKFSKSNSTYLGATVGIGQKTALNYKWNNYKADEAKTRAQQFNIMYKVLPGISAYAGYLNADTSGDFGGKTKTPVKSVCRLPMIFPHSSLFGEMLATATETAAMKSASASLF